MKNKNVFLIAICILLVISSLLIGNKMGGNFQGTDDKIKGAVSQINKNYKPWFKGIWKPPSSEVESFLFSLQAAAGAGFIGYYIGCYKGKKKDAKTNNDIIKK